MPALAAALFAYGIARFDAATIQVSSNEDDGRRVAADARSDTLYSVTPFGLRKIAVLNVGPICGLAVSGRNILIEVFRSPIPMYLYRPGRGLMPIGTAPHSVWVAPFLGGFLVSWFTDQRLGRVPPSEPPTMPPFPPMPLPVRTIRSVGLTPSFDHKSMDKPVILGNKFYYVPAGSSRLVESSADGRILRVGPALQPEAALRGRLLCSDNRSGNLVLSLVSRRSLGVVSSAPWNYGSYVTGRSGAWGSRDGNLYCLTWGGKLLRCRMPSPSQIEFGPLGDDIGVYVPVGGATRVYSASCAGGKIECRVLAAVPGSFNPYMSFRMGSDLWLAKMPGDDLVRVRMNQGYHGPREGPVARGRSGPLPSRSPKAYRDSGGCGAHFSREVRVPIRSLGR